MISVGAWGRVPLPKRGAENLRSSHTPNNGLQHLALASCNSHQAATFSSRTESRGTAAGAHSAEKELECREDGAGPAHNIPGSEQGQRAWAALCLVRQQRPLVQCITNYVAMDLSANTLLAAGASPAMVHAREEVEEFVALASALSVNIGTLTLEWVESMRLATGRAAALGKPWVLDPVGAGATSFRTKTCLELLALKPTVVRGNASEIMALTGAVHAASKGVDSAHDSADALAAARQLARSVPCIVAVSGAVDYVTDGERVLAASNGVPLLQQVTATGCSVTALIAAFLAVAPSEALAATAQAMALFGLAAELATAKGALGPGSLRVHLLDCLHLLDRQQVLEGVHIVRQED